MSKPSGTKFKGPIRSDNGFMSSSASFSLAPVLQGTVSVNPASLAAAASAETDVTITGVAVGDVVILNPPASLESDICFSGARAKAANTVAIRLSNIDNTNAVDGAALNWTYLILRPASV
jgi:hypothetical protein